MSKVVYGEFEWDSEKAAANFVKHGVTFEEATTIFTGQHLEELDLIHPERIVTIGYSSPAGRLLLVVTTERHERDRIISARKANAHERKTYEDQ